MKIKLKLVFVLLFSLLIVGCGGNDKPPVEDEPTITPTIEINENVNLNAIEKFTITNLEELGRNSIDDFIVETNEEYITYISDGYFRVNKVGNSTIKITDREDSNISTTVNLTINDYTSTYDVPEFRINKNYMTLDSSVALRLTNYSVLTSFDIILSNNDIIEIDSRNRINPIQTGKVDIYLKHKSDNACTNVFSLEVISLLPNIYITKDILLTNEKAYLNISNLDETFEKSLDEYIWSVNSDKATIENYSFSASEAGEYILTVTSVHNPLVTTSYNITVCDSNPDISLSFKEGYTGQAGKGDQFNIVLNNSYELENVTFISSDEEILRITPEGLVSVINEGFATISVYENGNPSNKCTYRVYVNGIANVDYIERLLNLALGEVGTVERQDENGNYVNDTKYNHWYNYDGAWCAMFVSWNWYHAGLSNDLLIKYMSCSAGMTWCQEQGIFHYKEDYTPKSGDIVFFMSAGMSHTGIVVYCDGDYIYTVEGNRSNRVDVWRISCTNATITGYASPNYPEYEGTPADFSWITGKDENGDYYWTPSGNQSTT